MSQEEIRAATLALHELMAEKSMGNHDPECAASNCLVVAAAVFEGVYPAAAEFAVISDETFEAYLARVGFVQRVKPTRYADSIA